MQQASRTGAPPKAKRESGYALLMVIFMVATLLLFAVAATPNVVIEGRRLKEQEDIWRGNQYVRAIRLYYQKTGRYPQTIDDLTKPDAAGNHFLRKTYTDLMNPDDGKWRMIYVSASGQLIGSVRYHSLQEMALVQNGLSGSLGTVAGGAGSLQPTVAGQTVSPTFGGQGAQTPAFGSSTQPQSLAPLEPVDGPVLGGFLIGVGGKSKKTSVMVYQGGKSYYEWEFIWNPLANGGAAGGTAALPGANANGTGATGTGTNGTGTNGTGTNGGATPPGGTPPNGINPTNIPPTGAAPPEGSAPGATAPNGTPPAAANPPASTPPPEDPNAPTQPPTQ